MKQISIIILLLLLVFQSLLAQEKEEAPFNIEVAISIDKVKHFPPTIFENKVTETAHITINFQNKSSKKQALWVGSWIVALLDPELSRMPYRTPIPPNHFWFAKDTTPNKSYWINFNANLMPIGGKLNEHSIKILNPTETFEVHFFTKDKELVKLFRTKKTKASLWYRYFPFEPLDKFLTSKANPCKNKVSFYSSSSNIYFNDTELLQKSESDPLIKVHGYFLEGKNCAIKPVEFFNEYSKFEKTSIKIPVIKN